MFDHKNLSQKLVVGRKCPSIFVSNTCELFTI